MPPNRNALPVVMSAAALHQHQQRLVLPYAAVVAIIQAQRRQALQVQLAVLDVGPARLLAPATAATVGVVGKVWRRGGHVSAAHQGVLARPGRLTPDWAGLGLGWVRRVVPCLIEWWLIRRWDIFGQSIKRAKRSICLSIKRQKGARTPYQSIDDG